MSMLCGSGSTRSVQALSAGALLALVHHMVTHAQTPDIPGSVVSTATWRSIGLLVGFGLSIPVFFATTYGLACGLSVLLWSYRSTGSAMGTAQAKWVPSSRPETK